MVVFSSTLCPDLSRASPQTPGFGASPGSSPARFQQLSRRSWLLAGRGHSHAWNLFRKRKIPPRRTRRTTKRHGAGARGDSLRTSDIRSKPPRISFSAASYLFSSHHSMSLRGKVLRTLTPARESDAMRQTSICVRPVGAKPVHVAMGYRGTSPSSITRYKYRVCSMP